ncbi:MAG: hypothetical protein PGN07_07595 [Aeromicrobium erythreum]
MADVDGPAARRALDALREAAEPYRRRGTFVPLPSPEILLVVLVLGTAVAISPLGQLVDRFLDLRPVRRDAGLLYTFLAEVLDRVSGQLVAGGLLLAVALWLAHRQRSLAPLLVAGLAEGLFLATGVLKILLAKSSTRIGEPVWWDPGLLAHGEHSMAYPSGHATESVVLHGTTLFLLAWAGPLGRPGLERYGRVVWHLVIVNTVLVSWLLGRHWASDLAAGLVWGLLCLTLVVGVAERGYPQVADQLLRPALLRARRRARRAPRPDRPRS